MYALYKDGKHVGDYAAKDIINFLRMSPKSFYSYVSAGFIYKKRYVIRKKEEDLELADICQEWDKWRKLLNPNAKEA